jgi:protein-tyrosine phosphatase
MTSFTDLHSHLVPGVDDGSSSISESLTSLIDLRDQGVGTVITTPHLLLRYLVDDAAVDRELERQREGFEHLVTALKDRPGLPRLGLGQEIWAPDAAMLRRIARRSDVGLGGGRFLLVEFGFELQGTHEDVVREAIAADRGIVIAHPERYRYLPGTEPLELMGRWRELGGLLQVNAGSFTGHYGPGPERLAWEMVSAGLVDLVASDHHGGRRVGVSPRDAFDSLVDRGHRRIAEDAMSRTPATLLKARSAQSLETGASVDPGAVNSPAEAASSRSPEADIPSPQATLHHQPRAPR